MEDRRFDSLVTKLGSGDSRRAVLTAICAGALAAVAGRFAGEAAEARKKRKKNKKKGDVNKLCKPQVRECLDILTPACAEDPACVAVVQLCCPELATCDIAGYITCLQANNP